MQVWNMLCAARWKYRTQKIAKKSPFGHHPTTLSGYIFATKAWIDNRKKLIKQQYLLNMSSQYGEIWPTSGWYRFVSLGHPCKFQRVSRLGSVTARQSSSERQPNFAALNRGRHLYSARRPSRWALAYISSSSFFPRLISAVADWMSAILANLWCRSETCCTRLAENTGRKKSPKIVIWAPSRNFVGLYLRN